MHRTRLALGSFGTLAALALSLAAGSASPAPTSTKTLLEGLRKAMLSEPLASIVSLHTVGSVEFVGIRGRAQEWDDLRAVRFTTAQNAGALSGASGWDGKVAWSQDYGGLVTIDGGTAGRLQAIDQAYLANLRYLRPDAGGATVIYAGARTAGDRTYDVLAVTPPHGSRNRSLDRSSYAPDRAGNGDDRNQLRRRRRFQAIGASMAYSIPLKA